MSNSETSAKLYTEMAQAKETRALHNEILKDYASIIEEGGHLPRNKGRLDNIFHDLAVLSVSAGTIGVKDARKYYNVREVVQKKVGDLIPDVVFTNFNDEILAIVEVETAELIKESVNNISIARKWQNLSGRGYVFHLMVPEGYCKPVELAVRNFKIACQSISCYWADGTQGTPKIRFTSC